MRTRFYDSLTNGEVNDYLRHNDLLFLPVGTVEMHGEMPLGCEHVLPLAVAVQMAELADALVLPHLAYFYPGATAIGRGTVTVSPSAGIAYLKEVSRSLSRQGFRRQVFLSAHGPASVTIAAAVREIFEETTCPTVYLDLVHHIGERDFNTLLWGAYHLLGRRDEIPLEQKPRAGQTPFPEAVGKLLQARLEVGYYFGDESQHGWWPERTLTPDERLARAEEGARLIAEMVAEIDPCGLVENMKELDKYIQHHVVPRHGERLR
jgi:creatinine amidohydrolase